MREPENIDEYCNGCPWVSYCTDEEKKDALAEYLEVQASYHDVLPIIPCGNSEVA